MRALGEYLLAEGRQPPEAALSIICESFGVSPREAKLLDPLEVRSILDYRALVAAKAQHEVDATKLSQDQAALWMEMLGAVNDGAG